MVDYVSYGGCKIYVRPARADEPNRWTPGVAIQRWGDRHIQRYKGTTSYSSWTDAILPSIALGKRIVDEERNRVLVEQ